MSRFEHLSVGPIAGDRVVVYLIAGGRSPGLTAKESTDA